MPDHQASAAWDAPRAAHLRCLAAAATFGLATPITSPIASRTSAFAVAGLLYVGAAIAVTPANVGRRLAVDRHDVVPTVVAIVAGGFVGPVLLVLGLARTSASTASLLLAFETTAGVAFAALLYREHVGRRVAAGALLITVAAVVLSWSGTPTTKVGGLLVIAAATAWGLDNSASARVVSISPVGVVLLKGAIAGTTNLTIGLAGAGVRPAVGDAFVVVLVGAVAYGASLTWWLSGARVLGAARAQVLFATAPAFGLLGAVVAGVDDLGWRHAAALALMAAAVWWSLQERHEHSHHHPLLVHTHVHRHDDGHHGHDVGGGSSSQPAPHPPVGADGHHAHAHRHDAHDHRHAHTPDSHHRHRHAPPG